MMLNELKQRAQTKGITWVGGEYQGLTNYVKGESSCPPALAIIGESLGKHEDEQGRPFVGAAGRVLDSVLSTAGVVREEVYISNLVKIRPPDNNITRLSELGFTLDEFKLALKEEIEELQPNCVLALGNYTLEALCNIKGITKWRGSILESTLIQKLKVIPSIHPAWILKGQYKMKPLLVLDVKRANEESAFDEIRLVSRNLIICPSFSDVRAFINKAKITKYVSFDIECDINGMISCISIGVNPQWAMSIPFRHGYRNYWSEGEELTIWRWLKELFNSGALLIAQNGLFDCGRLLSYVGYIPLYMDTMWAHQTVYAEIPKGLDTLASIYTKEPYYKDDRKVWKDASMSEQLWRYNAKDSAITLEVALRQIIELKELKLYEFFFSYVMRLFPILLCMQAKGIKIDSAKRQEIDRSLSKRADDLKISFNGMNPRSAKQMNKLLYDKLKLPKQYHPKQGNITTGKSALMKLYRSFKMPVLKDIIEYRHIETLRSSFINVPIINGRVYTSYGLVETGRLSSSRDEVGDGTHLQNVPDEIRPMFIADDGYTLVEVDKVQGEAMLVAWYAGDEMMKNIFKTGDDIHNRMAIIIFNKLNDDLRYKAKRMVHATNYKMGPHTGSGFVGMSVKDFEEAQRKYFSICPGILKWHSEVENAVSTKRILINAFGRRRMFFGMMGDELFREGIAFLPQSTLVDDVNRSLIECVLRHGDWIEALHQMHDGVIFQVKDWLVEKALKLIKTLFEQLIVIRGDVLTIPVKVRVGKSWGEMKLAERKSFDSGYEEGCASE